MEEQNVVPFEPSRRRRGCRCLGRGRRRRLMSGALFRKALVPGVRPLSGRGFAGHGRLFRGRRDVLPKPLRGPPKERRRIAAPTPRGTAPSGCARRKEGGFSCRSTCTSLASPLENREGNMRSSRQTAVSGRIVPHARPFGAQCPESSLSKRRRAWLEERRFLVIDREKCSRRGGRLERRGRHMCGRFGS